MRTSFTLCLLLLTASQGVLWSQQERSCLGCHPAPGLFGRLLKGQPTTAADELTRFKGAAHGKLNCTSCHPGTTPGLHATKPAVRRCEECHVSGTNAGGAAPLVDQLHAGAPKGPLACQQCHGHHGIAPAKDPASPVTRAKVTKLCAQCHENEEHSQTTPQVADYGSSIHAMGKAADGGPAATCTDCHAVHATKQRKNALLFTARTHEPQTCGRCHEKAATAYSHSTHGLQLLIRSEAMPACTDCHGKHNILSVKDPSSPASNSRIVATCGRCHGSEDFAKQHEMDTVAATTYEESYHGVAYRYGNPKAPTCASCHGAHTILPATSLESPTNPKNIAGSCAKCHPGAESSPGIGRFHVLAAPGSSWLLFIIQLVYQLLVIGSFAGFLAYIGLDLLAHRRLTKAGIEEQFEHRLQHLPRPPQSALRRMLPIERVQHWLLVISFITLAITGLALLIPDTMTGRIVIALCGGMSGRAIIHRLAAGLMVGNFIFQAIWMATTKRGRDNVRALLPWFSDARDLWQTVLLFLGVSRHRPSFGRYGFAEKFEFWALVWGTTVMALTGGMLMFIGWSLGTLPKWVIDAGTIIHRWEAILAVGAIAIWHIYHVVWKPGVYPGNRAWIDGNITFEQLVMEHPLEYARAMGWLPGSEEEPPPAEEHPEKHEEGEVS